MPDVGSAPQIGELVSALHRFAPQSLEIIKAKYPGQEVLFRRGEVLGDYPIPIACDLALGLMSRSADAAAQVFKRMRRRLRASWWFDLVAKLAATGGAAGAVAALFNQLSPDQGQVAGVIALVGSAMPCLRPKSCGGAK